MLVHLATLSLTGSNGALLSTGLEQAKIRTYAGGRDGMSKAVTEIDRARALIRAGDRAAGRTKLLGEVERGSIEAMTELAYLARVEGKDQESNEWMLLAERSVRPDDMDGHIALHGAYSLQLGPGTFEQRQQKALGHLTEVAEGGNSFARETLALYSLHGLNGCPKSAERFEHWIQLALSAGSKRAEYIYAEYLLKAGKAIPSTLLESLKEQRDENKAVAKLLRAIARAK